MEISEESVISLKQGQISSELPGEAVILNMDSGIYYGLNEVGSRIWDLISQEPMRFKALHSVLLDEYDVPEDTCRRDLSDVLLELKKADLIEVQN